MRRLGRPPGPRRGRASPNGSPRSTGIELAGVFTHEGHVYTQARDHAERERLTQEACRAAVETAEEIRGRGLAAPVVSVGSAGTFRFAVRCPGRHRGATRDLCLQRSQPDRAGRGDSCRCRRLRRHNRRESPGARPHRRRCGNEGPDIRPDARRRRAGVLRLGVGARRLGRRPPERGARRAGESRPRPRSVSATASSSSPTTSARRSTWRALSRSSKGERSAAAGGSRRAGWCSSSMSRTLT